MTRLDDARARAAREVDSARREVVNVPWWRLRARARARARLHEVEQRWDDKLQTMFLAMISDRREKRRSA